MAGTLKNPMAIAADESVRYSLFDLCCPNIDIEGISKREPAGMVSDQTELCFGINKTTFIDAATQNGSDFPIVAGARSLEFIELVLQCFSQLLRQRKKDL